ncbi:MAG: LPXTG cell wall anchor domain-containing protein [Acutalibacteraceae bacterium]|nr:LPXTG cell wall anchor domain-containing protein [Acutalibacteraceae bacterium]
MTKKTAVMLLAVLLLWVPCMTAFAAEASSDSATVTANVPATHRVTFIFHGGRGEENGVRLDEAAVYDRQSIHSYRLIPDDGKSIDKVLYAGEDVISQLTDGTFSAPPLIKDVILEVFCQGKEPVSEQSETSADTIESAIAPGTDTVKTGDTSSVAIILAVLIVSFASALVLVKGRKKMSLDDLS